MSSPVTKVASGGGTEVVRLSHFNIGGHALRTEHLAYLRTSVVPVLDSGGSVLLTGMASRSGSDATNKAISKRRTAEVLKQLRSMTKTNFKVVEGYDAGEELAQQAGVKNGNEDPFWRAVQVVYWNKPEPPPPPSEAPPTGKIDAKALAEMLDLDEHELNKLFNQYNWTLDSAINVVGMVGEFAPIAAGAAAMIGVGTLFAGIAAQWIGFFMFLKRLDEEQGIRFGTWAACYAVGDWVATSKLLIDGGVFEPEFPTKWVENNFGTPGMNRLSIYQEAWFKGAEEMSVRMREMLKKQYTEYSVNVTKEGRKAAGPRDFEQFAKAQMVADLGMAKFGKDAWGAGATNYIYEKIRPGIEEGSNLKIYLKPLPYPSTDLNFK